MGTDIMLWSVADSLSCLFAFFIFLSFLSGSCSFGLLFGYLLFLGKSRTAINEFLYIGALSDGYSSLAISVFAYMVGKGLSHNSSATHYQHNE